MAAFWTVHWHAGAAPFLHSLAYSSGRRFVGKWFGVLAAFSLSGVWHGWASAVLVEEPYGLLLGVQVWALFVTMGIVCLAERWIWGEKQGGWVQRIVVWAIAIAGAGQCFRLEVTEPKSSLLGDGAIAGIVVSAAAVLLMILGGKIWHMHRSRRKHRRDSLATTVVCGEDEKRYTGQSIGPIHGVSQHELDAQHIEWRHELDDNLRRSELPDSVRGKKWNWSDQSFEMGTPDVPVAELEARAG
ncbi:hypothetical protein LTR37_013682 [Vermiconidia calcicola]|uniref:Uncharacterized protein n=1 Tax=Vermiconidia calcicola TaxID=1690605 RepID=A0ACC3MVZ6_9PEZI|nr:hypothetical protein LTR37_013682 [Vermiconidia calcicola]